MYEIKNIKIIFNLEVCQYNNAFDFNYNPGACVIGWVPWTQEFGTGPQQNQTTFTFALPGCKYAYFWPYMGITSENRGRQNYTRMQELTYQPKYIQRDLTSDFSGQRNGVNFATAPLMLWSDRGYDNTDWFGYTATCKDQTSCLLSPSSQSLMLNSQESDGLDYLQSHTQDILERNKMARYWAMTTWENQINQEEVISLLESGGIAYQTLVGSAIHKCPQSSEDHRHWLICLVVAKRRS